MGNDFLYSWRHGAGLHGPPLRHLQNYLTLGPTFTCYELRPYPDFLLSKKVLTSVAFERMLLSEYYVSIILEGVSYKCNQRLVI